MEQTAVEWLVANIDWQLLKNTTTHYDMIVEQAKEMEKQQQGYSEEDMKLAFEAGHKKGFSGYPNTENWKELPFKEWFERNKDKFKNK